MADLIFSLNVTIPVFLVMIIGFIFRRTGIVSESFAMQMNRFVFKVALPVNLFKQMATVDIRSSWDTGFVIFCFAVTCASILIATVLSIRMKNKGERGEFIQATYRSSASLLGMVYIESIFPGSAMGPLMMIGSVPLYNIAAVTILMLTLEDDNSGASKEDRKAAFKAKLGKSLIGIAKNPILIGIVVGSIWAFLELPLPKIADKTISYIGGTASALGILSMGAMLDFGQIGKRIWPVLGASALKLMGLAAIFLPLAIQFGYRDDKLVALTIMLGSATAVASFTMAKNMGHEGSVSSGTVMLTTLLTSVSLTFWLFILRSRGFI